MIKSLSQLRLIKILLLIISFIAIFLTNNLQNLYAQSNLNYNDFVKSLQNVPKDSLALFLYQRSEDFLQADSLVFAKKMLIKCIKSAKQIEDTSLIGWANIKHGKVLNKQFEFNNSFMAFNNAFKISKILNDTNMMLEAMSGIENYYFQIERTDSAIVYCTRAIDINKTQKNYTNLSDNYGTLNSYQISYANGNTNTSFLFEGLMDSCINAALKANNPSQMVYALTGFGLNLYNRDSLLGFEYLNAAVDSARKLPPPSNALVYALTKSSTCYSHYGQIDKAKILMDEALTLAFKLNNTRQLTHLYYIQGRIYYKKDFIPQAIASYSKAINLAEKYHYNYYLPFIYEEFFELYNSQKIFDSSFVYQKKYMTVFNKEHDKNMNREIAKLSAIFQVEQKEKTISNLTIINDQKKAIITNQRNFIISLTLGIIGIIILFYLFYNQYIKLKNSHLKLSQNILEINKKNKEIFELRKSKNSQREIIYNELKIKLESFFEGNKIYLEKELSLTKTADLLNTNTSYLSAFINNEYNCNFNQFINKFRVQYASDLLSKREMDKYSIEGIAELSGFKTKSVFNQVFKKDTGVNPSVFRKATIEIMVN
ncbi:MAG: helix-turn-helix domain-containing protein [Bacteroidales bacterium]|nr:helix-turn-helix domain-containing protein [Bacteroidales bacterium]